MKKLLIFLIYISGYACSYCLAKHDIERDSNRWTVNDRTFSLVYSSGSWASAVAFGLIWVWAEAYNTTPAKW